MYLHLLDGYFCGEFLENEMDLCARGPLFSANTLAVDLLRVELRGWEAGVGTDPKSPLKP